MGKETSFLSTFLKKGIWFANFVSVTNQLRYVTDNSITHSTMAPFSPCLHGRRLVMDSNSPNHTNQGGAYQSNIEVVPVYIPHKIILLTLIPAKGL